MDLESLKKLKSTVERCIQDLANKQDLTPAETKAALDGMRLRDMLCVEIDDCEMQKEYSERGYSGYRSVPRHYTMTAYGMEGMSHYPGQPRDARGRYSGTDGWYRPERGSYVGDDLHGYSRHSIGDRAVEKLEQLMDAAGSEYEREELHKFIRMIRQAAD